MRRSRVWQPPKGRKTLLTFLFSRLSIILGSSICTQSLSLQPCCAALPNDTCRPYYDLATWSSLRCCSPRRRWVCQEPHWCGTRGPAAYGNPHRACPSPHPGTVPRPSRPCLPRKPLGWVQPSRRGSPVCAPGRVEAASNAKGPFLSYSFVSLRYTVRTGPAAGAAHG